MDVIEEIVDLGPLGAVGYVDPDGDTLTYRAALIGGEWKLQFSWPSSKEPEYHRWVTRDSQKYWDRWDRLAGERGRALGLWT